MVPADHNLVPADDFELLHHVCLIGRVDGLDTDRGLELGHREDIDHLDRVLVDELTQHDTHHLERNTRSTCQE